MYAESLAKHMSPGDTFAQRLNQNPIITVTTARLHASAKSRGFSTSYRAAVLISACWCVVVRQGEGSREGVWDHPSSPGV